MQCPICEKSFESEDLLSLHFEFHKSQSILNKPREPIFEHTQSKKQKHVDTKKIFGQERFDNLASKKIKSIGSNIEEMVYRRIFIEQIKTVVSKNPFLYTPYFIEDLFNGESSTDLCKKYLITYLNLKKLVQKTLDLKGNRYRIKQYDNALEMNLKIPTWKEKYHRFKDNCMFFEDELLELFFYNLVCSYIIIIMMDYTETGLKKENIISNVQNLKNDFELFKIIDASLQKKLEIYFTNNFVNIVDNIIQDLIQEKILQRQYSNPELIVGTLSIDKIKKEIINELRFNPDIHSEKQIKCNIIVKHQSILLLPSISIWKTALMELENEELIKLEYGSNIDESSLIFLSDNYQIIRQRLTGLGNIKLEFHGRKISPDAFIDELLYLELGDFGDIDDQITRIAGLVLAESIKLRAPHETIPEFDFSADMTNHNFRENQLQAIKNLNFVLQSNIFHYKVMLEETLTLEKYNRIKRSLPDGDQGIIITFMNPSQDVKQILKHDKSIQIIDKEGLKAWVSITPVIPARKNSIVKIYSDPISNIEKRVAKVNLINYESGLASVLILPEMRETTVLTRSLQEISMYSHSPAKFTNISNNYFKLLSQIIRYSNPEDFIEAIFDNKIQNYVSDNSKRGKFVWEIELENNNVKINLGKDEINKIFKCSCYHWIDFNIPYTLCKHCIMALDQIGRSENYFDTAWNAENRLKHALDQMTVQTADAVLENILNDIPTLKRPLIQYLTSVYDSKD